MTNPVLGNGKFGNGLKFLARGSSDPIDVGPIYGSNGFLALRRQQLTPSSYSLHRSTDGVNWFAEENHNLTIPGSSITGIVYTDNSYVVYGYAYISGVWTTYISISTDGITWTNNVITNVLPGGIRTLVKSGSYWVATTTNTGVNAYTSTNLTTWTVRTNFYNSPSSTRYWSYGSSRIETNGTQVVAIGRGQQYRDVNGFGNFTNVGDEAIILHSYNNGVTWSGGFLGANDNTPDGWYPTDVAYGAGLWVLVGSLGNIYTTNSIPTSGKATWTKRTSNTTSGISTVTYSNGYFVARTSDSVLKSTDGINWSSTSVPVIESDDILYLSNGNIDYSKSIYAYNKWISGDVQSNDLISWSIIDYQLPNKQPFVKYDSSPDWSTWKSMDLWIYITQASGVFSEYGIASRRGTTSTNTWSFSLEQQASGSLRFRIFFNGSVQYSFTVTSQFSYSVWNHIRVVSNGTTGAFYLNGSRIGTFTSPSNWGSSDDTLNIGYTSWAGESRFSRPVDYYIDEFMLTQEVLNDPSLTSITVPTTPWQNNDYTSLLLHYDTNFEDDPSTPLRNGTSFVNATFTEVVSSTKTAGASAALTSTANSSANAILVKNVNANLSSSFSLSINALDLDFASAQLESKVLLTANVGVVKQLSSSSTANATVSTNNSRVRYAGANLTAFDTVVIATGRIVVEDAQLESRFTATINATKIAQVSSELSIQTQQTTQAKKLNSTPVQMSSEFSLGIVVDKVIEFTSTEPTVSTMLVSARKTARAQAAFNSTTSLYASTSRDIKLSGSLFNAASVTCSAKVTKTITSNVTARATVLAITNNVVRAQANLNVGAFELAIGRVIDLTNAVSWIIPAENRTRKIYRSNTNWTISREDRTFKIKG